MLKIFKKHFLNVYKGSGVRYRTFPHHVDIVTKWVEKLCDLHPEADREVAVIASYLHDIGHFIGKTKDHAASSELESSKLLNKTKITEVRKNKILHAIRAHRNNDVKPETIEAKIVCCADSASHFSAEVYLTVLSDHTKKEVLEKLERDYRDLSNFPEIKKGLTPLYKSWKQIIEHFPEDFIKFIPKK